MPPATFTDNSNICRTQFREPEKQIKLSIWLVPVAGGRIPRYQKGSESEFLSPDRTVISQLEAHFDPNRGVIKGSSLSIFSFICSKGKNKNFLIQFALALSFRFRVFVFTYRYIFLRPYLQFIVFCFSLHN